MKICILTQPLGQNYGGIMQCYALEQVLIRMGHEPVAIDWIHPSPVRKILSYTKQLFLHAIGKKRGKLRSWLTNKEKKFLFNENFLFIQKELRMSKPMIATKRMAPLKPNQFDCYIVGSDQVWTLSSSPRFKTFFLDFTEKETSAKKIAYAASFNGEWKIKKSMESSISYYARRFDALSCREESASKILAEKWGTKVQTVLDPTFLLNKDDYVHLFPLDAKRKIGVFGYFLDDRTENEDLLKYIAEHHDYTRESICIETMIKSNSPLCSPREWLSKIYNAQFVITDSFHGMVFSIIFEKDFIVLLNTRRGGKRFIDLLNAIGLSNRCIKQNDSLSPDIFKEHIDYSIVNMRLKELKLKSIEFLLNALKN